MTFEFLLGFRSQLFRRISFVNLVVGASLWSLVANGFYSPSGVNAEVTYDSYIYVEGARPNSTEARDEVYQTLNFMAGPLQKIKPNAGPKYDHQITIKSISDTGARVPSLYNTSEQSILWKVDYSYKGTFIIERENYQNLRLRIPLNRRRIYEQGLDTRYRVSAEQARNESLNERVQRLLRLHPCIAYDYEGYLNEAHFWYFWSPQARRTFGLFGGSQECHLKTGEHYIEVAPTIRLLNDPSPRTQTFPEYERLKGEDGYINMVFVFGADKDENGMKRPEDTNDANVENYKNMIRYLTRNGFSETRWNQARFNDFCRISHYQLTQTISEMENPELKIRAKVLWGTTSTAMDSRGEPLSIPFYCLLSHGLADGSLIQYVAHSGMGSSVYINQLRDRLASFAFRMNPSKYQIMMFIGCSSYGYYNELFNREKRMSEVQSQRHQGSRGGNGLLNMTAAQITQRSQNLDVISNGLVAYFDRLTTATLPMVEAILEWKRSGEVRKASYQQILGKMEMQPTALTNVTGDEPNESAK